MCPTKTAIFRLLSLRGGWLCLPCATHLCLGALRPSCCSQQGKAAIGQTSRGTEQLSPGSAGPGLQALAPKLRIFLSESVVQEVESDSKVWGQWNTLELHRGPTSQQWEVGLSPA